MQVEIDQGEVRAEPVMVLRDATIAHLVEAEDAFQDAEHLFYFRSYFRLGCVLSFRFFVHIVFELTTHLETMLVEQDFDRECWTEVSVSGPDQLERILADAGS